MAIKKWNKDSQSIIKKSKKQKIVSKKDTIFINLLYNIIYLYLFILVLYNLFYYIYQFKIIFN
jgi:hypothetical protein